MTRHLASVPAERPAQFWRRFTSEPVGCWEINSTAAGIDVWTQPVEPLTPAQAVALGDALREAGGAQ